ncbi:DNA-binding Lrp family transcriptional regulator [Catenulispora sp. MAP5-51]|uniref:Lrp/AsnC family transcriptional regulator n=1 Tax=Catenulispora sp. MAP5-51 TaxID=3156298 RepID=UPI003516B7E2
MFGVLEDFTPLRHLGRATGYYSAVRTRVQRLMASGVLQIAAVSDPLALGLPVMALLGIKVDRSLREITDALGDIGSVIHLVATAGSFDLFAEVVCRAMDE